MPLLCLPIRVLFASLLLVMLPSGALGQQLGGSSLDSSLGGLSLQSNAIGNSLTATEFLPVDEAYQLSGNHTGDGKLALNWDIAEGYYLYQHRLKFVAEGETLTPQLPAGEIKYDEYFEKELEVYYHQLNVELPSTSLPYELKVHSQGCADAGLCYPPQIQTYKVTAAGISLQAPPGPSGTPASAQDTGALGFTALLLTMLAAALGGVILNLMPCVFPVLSLKALSLAQSHNSPHQQHLHGWAYTLGAVATFVLVAAIMLALREAGQAVGWGFQLQSPTVVAALAYLFFIMGLVLSGHLALGGSFAGTGQSLTTGQGLKSSFFTGALATVVASPCTAPFMGGALGAAVTQPAPIALLIFASLGFGMALPVLILSYYPKLSRLLPKPGAWMEQLKQFLAFPLYATALWLLWVLGRQTGVDQVAMLLAGAIALTLAAWLWQQQAGWTRALAALTAIAALYPLASPMETTQAHPQALKEGWQPYSVQRLQELRSSNTPVFINLTADWCITCLLNERVALETERTRQAFDNAGVVRLKGDWTHYNPAITELLATYGRNGVPLYLLYPASNQSDPAILPQILTESTLIEAINAIKNEDSSTFSQVSSTR